MSDDVTDDLFFDGRLKLLQPRRGHRFGSDAALLVAAARSRLDAGAAVADLGAGVGAVGLALAACGAGRSALVEIDEGLSALGRENVRRNGFDDTVAAVCSDVALIGRRGGPEATPAGQFGLVAMNPPFDDGARRRASPDAAKARAHSDAGDVLETWISASARLLGPGGSLVMIHRPEALGALIAALQGRFGDVTLRAVHPQADRPAARVLVAARKGRRGALTLQPPLVMHGVDGRFTPEADAAQRGDMTIAMG